MNMKKRLCSFGKNIRRGFTLVEVSVSLVVLVMIISVSSGIILVSSNIFAKDAVLNDYQITGNDVFDFVSNKLAYAGNFTVSDEASVDGTIDNYYYEQISLTDGGKKLSVLRPTVMTEPVVFFGPDTLDEKAIKLFIDAEDVGSGHYLVLTVEIYENSLSGNLKYTTSGVIPLLNYKASMIKNVTSINNTGEKDLYITYSFIE